MGVQHGQGPAAPACPVSTPPHRAVWPSAFFSSSLSGSACSCICLLLCVCSRSTSSPSACANNGQRPSWYYVRILSPTIRLERRGRAATGGDLPPLSALPPFNISLTSAGGGVAAAIRQQRHPNLSYLGACGYSGHSSSDSLCSLVHRVLTLSDNMYSCLNNLDSNSV